MKRLGMIAILAFLRASIFSADPNPADSQIKLGGFDLRLGMSQAETLETLRAAYDVRYVEGSKGIWGVVSRDGPPFTHVGLLGFRRGKLSYASKSWFPSEGTARDFAQAVFNATRSVDGRKCSVSSNDQGSFQTVKIDCGHRVLTITLPSDANSAPSVQEDIRTGE